MEPLAVLLKTSPRLSCIDDIDLEYVGAIPFGKLLCRCTSLVGSQAVKQSSSLQSAVQPAFAQGYGGSAEAIHVIAPAEADSQQSSNRAVICVLVAKAGVRYVLRGTKADYNARAYGELVWLLNQVVD